MKDCFGLGTCLLCFCSAHLYSCALTSLCVYMKRMPLIYIIGHCSLLKLCTLFKCCCSPVCVKPHGRRWLTDGAILCHRTLTPISHRLTLLPASSDYKFQNSQPHWLPGFWIHSSLLLATINQISQSVILMITLTLCGTDTHLCLLLRSCPEPLSTRKTLLANIHHLQYSL